MSVEPRGGLALTRIGAILVGVEGDRVTAFFEPGEREADCDLAEILSLSAPDGATARLLEVQHAAGRFIMSVHGRIRMAASESRLRWERPLLIAGVFRQACLRGVVRHESKLVYLLDVEEVAARIGRGDREEGAT